MRQKFNVTIGIGYFRLRDYFLAFRQSPNRGAGDRGRRGATTRGR